MSDEFNADLKNLQINTKNTTNESLVAVATSPYATTESKNASTKVLVDSKYHEEIRKDLVLFGGFSVAGAIIYKYADKIADAVAGFAKHFRGK